MENSNGKVDESKLDNVERNEQILTRDDLTFSSNNDLYRDDDISNSFSFYEENLLNLLYNSFDPDNCSLDEKIDNIGQSSNIKIYKPNKLNYLYNQNIENIRNKKKMFIDDVFKPSINSLTTSSSSSFAFELLKRFNFYQNSMNLNDLNKEIIWKRCQVYYGFLGIKFFSFL
jgi:hypothetical protein